MVETNTDDLDSSMAGPGATANTAPLLSMEHCTKTELTVRTALVIILQIFI